MNAHIANETQGPTVIPLARAALLGESTVGVGDSDTWGARGADPGASATIPSQGIARIAQTLAPFIGVSRWHRDMVRQLDLLAHDARPLAIAGDTGTGKTLVAHHLHWRSAAAASPCERIDLRQMAPELVESELFGYVRGGLFQRAGQIAGLVAAAGDGTVIVQGLDRLPPAVQERLVPWFTDQTGTPVGTETAEHFPARIVVELRAPGFPRAKESALIAPLYDIVRQSVLEMPPLTTRRDDILPIADYYLTCYAQAWGCPARRFEPEAARLLRRGAWRENVRGLLSAVAGALRTASGEAVTASQLPPWVAGRVDDAAALGLEGVALEEIVEQKLADFFERLGRYEVHDVYDTVIQKIERPLLRLVLQRTGGNQLRAARILGINRNTLRSRLRALGLK